MAQERPRSIGGFDRTQQLLSQGQTTDAGRSFRGYDSDLRSVSSSGGESGNESDVSGAASDVPPPLPPAPAVLPPAPAVTGRYVIPRRDPDPGIHRQQSVSFPAGRGTGAGMSAAMAAPAAAGPSMAMAASSANVGGSTSQIAPVQLLRTWFPLLHAMPDAMMAQTDLATLSAISQSMSQQAAVSAPGTHSLNLAEVAAQAAAAAAAHMGLSASSNRDEDPGIVMARSLESLRDRPVQVAAGEDNRSDKLHPARFLGGTVCSAKKLWREAREQLGLDGIPALANYDMAAIGLGGCVTARAWKELHNPASMNITVKLFSAANMSSSTGSTRKLSLADGDKSIHVGESMKEIADLGELQLAVRAMCRASQFVHPWNQSFNAIEGFLQSSDWARAELSGRSNRAGLLTDFINYVLGLNAQAWQQKEDFRSSGEIKVLWGEWFGSRPASLLAAAAQDNRQSTSSTDRQKQGGSKQKSRSGQHTDGRRSGGGGSGKSGFTVPPYPPPAPPTQGGGGQSILFCYKFNNGNCPNPAGSCALPSGTKLHHLCNAYNSNGAICKMQHPRSQHH